MLKIINTKWSNWENINLQYNGTKSCNVLTQMRTDQFNNVQFKCIQFAPYIIIKNLDVMPSTDRIWHLPNPIEEKDENKKS